MVCADAHWGIGRKGDLLVRIPEDLRLFRAYTLGKTILMGHTTFRGLPGGRPLDGRRNVVLSRDTSLVIPGAKVIHTREEALALDDCVVCGGQAVYELMLPYCEQAYVTRLHVALDADRTCPTLDQLPDWQLTESIPGAGSGFTWDFQRYTRLPTS